MNAVYERLQVSKHGMTPSELSRSLSMPLVDVRDHLTELVNKDMVKVDWDKISGVPYYLVAKRPVVKPSETKSVIKVKPSRLTEFLTSLHASVVTDLEKNPTNLDLAKVNRRLSQFIQKYTTTESL